MPRRIAILTTHPIQYQVPWFQALDRESELAVEVLFCHRSSPQDQAGAGFGVEFEWDVPLLDGYRYRFLDNVAKSSSVDRFMGMDAPQLRSEIASGQFDAIVVNGWYYKAAWQAFISCWQSGVPVMARSDSHLHSLRHPLKSFLKWLPYRCFIPRLNACLAVGQWSREYYLAYGAKPDRIFTVPHVVDEKWFLKDQSQPGTRATLRRRWELDTESVVFLFAGKFIEKKRPLDFIQAVHQSSSGGLPIEGLMVGDGPLRKECQELADKLSAPIRFAGFLNQTEMSGAYSASDALVLASGEGETWGLVVNEAMASGRPCIVSDRVGAGPDLVRSGKTGFTFPMGNVAKLASIMKECTLEEKDKLREMGREARRVARENNIDRAVRGLREAVNYVCYSSGISYR